MAEWADTSTRLKLSGGKCSMIFSLVDKITDSELRELAEKTGGRILPASPFRKPHLYVPAIGSKMSRAEVEAQACVADYLMDIEGSSALSMRRFQKSNTEIEIQPDLVFGRNQTILMAGPCSIESREQGFETASYLSEQFGMKIFRAGAFKPRTSPFSFQGSEQDGLDILQEIRQKFGMKIISEVKDATHFDAVAEAVDIIQIGTKAMYDPAVLKKCGEIDKPILLKRGFMSTIKEFLQAADFIMVNGNWRVILCERGIRGFEPETRFCLDLGGLAVVKANSHLPVVIDPSHAIGKREFVADLACAGSAMGLDGLLVEVHREPEKSFSDARQALSHQMFADLTQRVGPIIRAAGRQPVPELF